MVDAAATASDSLREHYIYDTSCETVVSTGRRHLSGYSNSLEITLYISAPALSSSTLAAGVVGDLNAAVEDGSFVASLQASDVTAFAAVSVGVVYSTDSPPSAVPTPVPTAVPTVMPTSYYSTITKGEAVAVGMIIFVCICCCSCWCIIFYIAWDRRKKQSNYGASRGKVYASMPVNEV